MIRARIVGRMLVIAITTVQCQAEGPQKVITSSKTAWVWVSHSDWQELEGAVREIGSAHGWQFQVRAIPAQWEMIEYTLSSPEPEITINGHLYPQIEVTVTNATQYEKFHVGITLLKEPATDEWIVVWRDLKDRLSSRWRWEDVSPK